MCIGYDLLKVRLPNLKKEKEKEKEIMGQCAFWRERILWYIGTILVSLWWWCCLHIALPFYVFKCYTRHQLTDLNLQFLCLFFSVYRSSFWNFKILKFIILSHNMRHDFVYSFHGQGQVICLHDHFRSLLKSKELLVWYLKGSFTHYMITSFAIVIMDVALKKPWFNLHEVNSSMWVNSL